MLLRSREASQLCALLKPALVGQCWGAAAAAPTTTAPAAALPQAAAAMLGLRCMASTVPSDAWLLRQGQNLKAAKPARLKLEQRFIEAVGTHDCGEIFKKKAVLARRQLEQRCPWQVFQLKGVTFEGRQDVIKRLRRGQALMFEQEPSNPADPGAVHVKTMKGASVGYIAQNLTGAFVLPVCFGAVVSKGAAYRTDSWGVSVACCPSLHGITLDLLPESWHEQTDMQQVFGEAGWQQLQQQVLKRYQHRCAVTSIPASEVPLQVVPQWQYDRHKRQVQLAELVPVCQPVLVAQLRVLRYICESEEPENMESFGDLEPFMNLRDDEQSYIRFVRGRQARLRWEDEPAWQLLPPAADKWLAAAAAAAADDEG